jgi:hypothetical protein
MLIVDTAVASLRHAVFGPQLPPAAPLARLLAAQARAPRCTLGNAGNDAWLTLGAMIAMVDRTSTPLNTATVGGAVPSPIPHPIKTASPSNPPQAINTPNIRPRYNSVHPSLSPLPFPTTSSADSFPFPSPGTNPNARPISAVFARPRTGSAGAQASPRNSLSLNGLSINPGPSLNFDPVTGPALNRTARPISAVMGSSTSRSSRNSVNLTPSSPDDFGAMGGGGSAPLSRSWNGRSILASGRPQTPLGLSGGYFDTKPGRGSKLVISPSIKPGGGDDSTEDESEDTRESEGEPNSQVKGRPSVA